MCVCACMCVRVCELVDVSMRLCLRVSVCVCLYVWLRVFRRSVCVCVCFCAEVVCVFQRLVRWSGYMYVLVCGRYVCLVLGCACKRFVYVYSCSM